MTIQHYDHIESREGYDFLVYSTSDMGKDNAALDKLAERLEERWEQDQAPAPSIQMDCPTIDMDQLSIDIAMQEHDAGKDPEEHHEETSTSRACDHAIATEATTNSDLSTYRKSVEKSYDLDWMLQMTPSQANHGHHLVQRKDAKIFQDRLTSFYTGIAQCFANIDADELVPDVLDAIVIALNRQMTRKGNQLTTRQDTLSEAIREDNGTEIQNNKIIEAQAYCYLLERHEQILELACIGGHHAYQQFTGRPWVPNNRPFSAKHTETNTAATASSAEWKKRRDKTEDATFRLPKGTPVAITGGFDQGNWTADKLVMWQKFDKLRVRYQDMVLILTDETGANREAQKWAETNNVPNVLITADFQQYGKSAAFRRNDEVLRFAPVAMLCFKGNGPSQQLQKDAATKSIEILRAG
ncbi:MAG: DUF2493 domain-containing protein [Verrucomicrobia bacterium]|nr:DUF2493 domain-containing protein [Verrucomicrobiota bacterium]